MKRNDGKNKGWKRALKILAVVAGIWAGVLLILQVALSPAVLTGIVEKFAGEYIDADLDFESIGVSMFRNFPDIRLEMENCSVTYAHDRYDGSIDPDIKLQQLGRGEKDTLAVFEQFTLRVNPFSLFAWKLKIREISLSGPRIFANTYADGRSNWDIFPKDGTVQEDEDGDTGFTLPRIQLGRVAMNDYPTVSFTLSSQKTGVMLRMKEAVFSGRLDRDFAAGRNVGLKVDSLFAAGRVGPDTLMAGIDRLRLSGGRDRVLNLELVAKALIGTDEVGRLGVPVAVEGEVQVLKDSVPAFDIRGLKGSLAWIPFELKGRLRSLPDSLEMNMGLDITGVEAARLLQNYGAQLISAEALKVRTDAVFDASVQAVGSYAYADGSLPELSGGFHIPEASFSIDGTGLDGRLALDGIIDTDDRGRIDVDLKRLLLSVEDKASFNGRLRIEDVLGCDPALVPDVKLNADLDKLGSLLPEHSGMTLRGNLDCGLKGRARLSQLDLYKLANTDLIGYLKSDELAVKMPSDSIDLYATGLDLGLETRRDTVASYQNSKSRMLDIQAGLDTVSLQYGASLLFRGKGMKLSMQNDASVMKMLDSITFWPMKGAFSARRLSLRDSDSTSVGLSATSNSFRITHLNGDLEVPVLSLSSSNRSLRLKSTSGRVFARNLNLNLNAQMRTKERNLRRKRRLDSLALLYPGVPQDSLMKVAYSRNRASRFSNALAGGSDLSVIAGSDRQSQRKGKDFENRDPDLRLDGELRKYFTQWNLNGQIGAERVKIVTHLLPLENVATGVNASFNNDRIDLKSLRFASGSSELDFTGSISGMRKALLGRGRLKLDAKLVADRLNCNELLAAYAAGQQLDMSAVSDMSDEEYEAAMKTVEDTAETTD
ncbi:MAG: hypothetical protein ACI39U_00030, partial [Candidatus Cryptobacteroides sp.]